MKRRVWLLILPVFLASGLVRGEEGVFRGSIGVRQAMAGLLRQADSTLSQVVRSLGQRAQAEKDSREARGTLGSLRDEWRRALQELRQGLYCSKCKRPKSQIQREENETFPQHLGRVSGEAIPASGEHIESKRAEYERKMQAAEKRVEAADDKVESIRSTIDEGSSKLLTMASGWLSLHSEEVSLRGIERSVFVNAEFRAEQQVEDASTNVENAQELERDAERRTQAWQSGDALEYVDAEDRYAALAANQAHRDAQSQRIQRERERLAAKASLVQGREEWRQATEVRNEDLEALEVTRKALLARANEAGVPLEALGWNWVGSESTDHLRQGNERVIEELKARQRDLHAELLKAAELDRTERRAVAEGTRHDVEYVEDLRRQVSSGASWAEGLLREKVTALRRGQQAGEYEEKGALARAKDKLGRIRATAGAKVDSLLDSARSAMGLDAPDTEDTHMLKVLGDHLSGSMDEAFERGVMEGGPEGGANDLMEEFDTLDE